MNYLKIIFLSMGLLSIMLMHADDVIIKGKIYNPGNTTHFEDALLQYDFVVVDFYADWCGPCKQMHKIFDSLAQDSELDMVLFIKIDTEKHRNLSAQYHIASLPTVIFFVDGKPIRFLYGLQDKRTLKNIIKETFFEQ